MNARYCELSANLSRKCTAACALNGEQKKQKVSEIKTGIDEAEALIRKMDLEARSLQPNVKAVLLAKLREYKSDLNNLKSEVKRIVSGNLNLAARDELLESGMADTLTASADQRGRLMMSTERLTNVNLCCTAHSTLHGVDDNIGKSKRILTSMARRMNKNKWIVGSIVLLLILAIILVLYFKLK
ncbi:Vesicle transport v-SNARE like [Quillaja saponaria]|uniref:Vesicle transport v-SNARE like n=1 Tax=Quillaja saponaria TaxID=32244 RepID=A0AAD7PXI8_QUISA|nr:Vesicle transport v-SNARE like [Quillaja saponaria]